MKISKGKIVAPHLHLVFGTDSAGKSTFAANAPAPIFIGAESGTNNLDTSRVDNIKTYKDVHDALDFLIKDTHEYQTVVIDSLDFLEPMLYQFLIDKYKVDAIENCAGGYGKYLGVVLAEWKTIIEKLLTLRDVKKMNVILIAHAQVKAFNDPNLSEPYERYVLKLQDKTSALFRELCDCVLFFNFETFVKKDKNMSKAKAFSDNERYIFTEKTAAYDAKNRFGLPAKIKLDPINPFIEFEKILKGSSATDIELIKTEINGLVLDVTNKELLPKINEAITKADTYAKLCAIRDRLIQISGVN